LVPLAGNNQKKLLPQATRSIEFFRAAHESGVGTSRYFVELRIVALGHGGLWQRSDR
jgi:hypothetical protein